MKIIRGKGSSSMALRRVISELSKSSLETKSMYDEIKVIFLRYFNVEIEGSTMKNGAYVNILVKHTVTEILTHSSNDRMSRATFQPNLSSVNPELCYIIDRHILFGILYLKRRKEILDVQKSFK